MGRKATFVATLVERVSKNQEKLRTSEVLNSDLLDVGLLDLVWEPSRAASRLVDHEMEPVKTCTRLVPRSRRRMFVCPRVAALRAAPRGCLLANTWLVSLPFSMRTKYFLSDIWITSETQSQLLVIIICAEKRQYCATYGFQ